MTSGPAPTAIPAEAQRAPSPARVIDSRDSLGGSTELRRWHEREEYRLRVTRLNELVLMK
jgi:hemin uptake protein HemP